jgi:hypothetical protein
MSNRGKGRRIKKKKKNLFELHWIAPDFPHFFPHEKKEFLLSMRKESPRNQRQNLNTDVFPSPQNPI